MADELTREQVEAGIADSVGAEEYQLPSGRRVKRASPDVLKRVRDDLQGEERVAAQGNVLQRGMSCRVRRD